MQARSIFSVTVATAVFLYSLSARSLSLGPLQINSAMGEPLQAEIEVTRFSPEELQNLSAVIAGQRVFQADGMTYNAALSTVTSRLDLRSRAKPFIVLTGTSPIREPFLDLILETKWSSGEAVKRYSVQLNPASAASIRPQTERSQGDTRVSQSISTNSEPYALNDKQVPVYRFDSSPVPSITHSNHDEVNVTPVSDPIPSNARLTSPATASGTLVVHPGSTASQMAMANLPATASLAQMLLALLERNPDAFINGNVNLIKAGAGIHLPESAKVLQISKLQAESQIAQQTEDFHNYSHRLASSASNVPIPSSSREASGKVTAQQHSQAEGSPSQLDHLTLSKSTSKSQRKINNLMNERQAQDAQNQIEELNRNLKKLETLKKENTQWVDKPSTSNEVPVEQKGLPIAEEDAKSVHKATAPESSLQPEPPKAVTPADATIGQSIAEATDKLRLNQQLQLWIAALLAFILAAAVWMILRRSRKTSRMQDQPTAPTHATLNSADGMLTPEHMPHEMPNLDLNLGTASTMGSSGDAGFKLHKDPASPNVDMSKASDNTDLSKLILAEKLLISGEKDLAESLLRSVASSAKDNIKK